VANDEDVELVPVPHRRERPPRRLRAAANDRIQAVVRVRLAPAASRSGFEQYLRTLACVLGACQVTGGVDYELLVACPVIADLDGVLTCLRRCGGIEVTSADLVLRVVSGLGAVDLAPELARAAGNGRFDGGH
jgi:hypothetical protein